MTCILLMEEKQLNEESISSGLSIIKDIKDLDRKVLQLQIQLDLKSGIKVHLFQAKCYKTLETEEDFCIWDDEYVCIIHRDKNGKQRELLLDSRIRSIAKTQAWREKNTQKFNRNKIRKRNTIMKSH